MYRAVLAMSQAASALDICCLCKAVLMATRATDATKHQIAG